MSGLPTTLVSCVAVCAATAVSVWLLLGPEPPSQRLFGWVSGSLITSILVVIVLFVALENDETIRIYRAHVDLPPRPLIHMLAYLAGAASAFMRFGDAFVGKIEASRHAAKRVPLFNMIFIPTVGVLLFGTAINDTANMAVHANWKGFLQFAGLSVLFGTFLITAVISIRRERFGKLERFGKEE